MLVVVVVVVVFVVLVVVLALALCERSSSACAVIRTIAFAAASFADQSHYQVEIFEGVFPEPKGASDVLDS